MEVSQVTHAHESYTRPRLAPELVPPDLALHYDLN